MTQIKDSTILITGADGGIGIALVKECLVQGAKKIYATGLKLENLNQTFRDVEKVVPVELDVTNSERIKECAELCADTNLLINNAGVEFKIPFIAEKSSQAALMEMKVNYIALIEMINSFIPNLEKLNHAGIVNILSLGALAIVKRLGTYCASKSAAHVLTETIREELEEKNIKVMATYIGYVDTSMVPEETKTEKSTPKNIAIGICEGINKNESHIYPDKTTKNYIEKYPIKTVFYE
ncbi:MAG: SDR family NAD(P)-dependent oxidoreductase [Flavobacteriales bacterium]|jgi:short-subunit dehydrogenase|nr:SDR family NAD(P)-dependent oxidoreductase [Flavobacteriales bacterium]